MNVAEWFNKEEITKQRLQLTLHKPKFVIAVDCADDKVWAYCLIREIGGIVETILTKQDKPSKSFRQEVEKLAQYFDATLIESK